MWSPLYKWRPPFSTVMPQLTHFAHETGPLIHNNKQVMRVISQRRGHLQGRTALLLNCAGLLQYIRLESVVFKFVAWMQRIEKITQLFLFIRIGLLGFTKHAVVSRFFLNWHSRYFMYTVSCDLVPSGIFLHQAILFC